MKITVLGAGSWGTTLALVLYDNHHEVNLWTFDGEQADLIREKHENPQFLPGIILPAEINITTDIEASCHGRDMIVAAVTVSISSFRSSACCPSRFRSYGHM